MKCPVCGGVNKDGSSYCEYCGAGLKSACSGCGNASSCDKCKKKGERISYDTKVDGMGFRYAALVSYVLLIAEIVYSGVLVFMKVLNTRFFDVTYTSVFVSYSIPFFRIVVLVLSCLCYTGLKKREKTAYVLLLIIHCLLFVKALRALVTALLLIPSSIAFTSIFYFASIVYYVLSFVYFLKRRSYWHM